MIDLLFLKIDVDSLHKDNIYFSDEGYRWERRVDNNFAKKKEMKRNVGKRDQFIRVLLSAVIAAFTFIADGEGKLLFYSISLILLATAGLRFCPLYWPFRWSTPGKS